MGCTPDKNTFAAPLPSGRRWVEAARGQWLHIVLMGAGSHPTRGMSALSSTVPSAGCSIEPQSLSPRAAEPCYVKALFNGVIMELVSVCCFITQVENYLLV